MAASFGQQRVAQQQEPSSSYKSIHEAAFDKAPLTSRSPCGCVWSSPSRGRNWAALPGVTLATAGADKVHTNALLISIPAEQHAEAAGAGAADLFIDDAQLDSCRLPSHTAGAFVRYNKLFERSGNDAQAAAADQCGSLHAACLRDAARPTAVHDNSAFQPAATAATAANGDEGSAAGRVTTAQQGTRGETLYDNEAFDAAQSAPQRTAPGPKWTTTAHIGQFSQRRKQQQQQRAQRPQQQQQRRRQRAVGGVSVPEHLRPRFSWSTAASRAKAMSRSS